MRVVAHGGTHRGLVREENQDAYLLDETQGVFGVADGLGGLPAGGEASQLALSSLRLYLQQHPVNGHAPDFRQAFRTINEAVFATGHREHGEMGMATTLTLAHVSDGLATVAHAGDSAAYLWQKGRLRLLTPAHNMAYELGNGARLGRRQRLPEAYYHTLTRCIGAERDLNPELTRQPLSPGDRLILCTDGLTKVVEEREIEETIGSFAQPKALVQGWIDLVLSRGAPDNVSIVALFAEDGKKRAQDQSGEG